MIARQENAKLSTGWLAPTAVSSTLTRAVYTCTNFPSAGKTESGSLQPGANNMNPSKKDKAYLNSLSLASLYGDSDEWALREERRIKPMTRKPKLACDCGRATHTYLSCGVPLPTKKPKQKEPDSCSILSSIPMRCPMCGTDIPAWQAHQCKRVGQ